MIIASRTWFFVSGCACVLVAATNVRNAWNMWLVVVINNYVCLAWPDRAWVIEHANKTPSSLKAQRQRLLRQQQSRKQAEISH